MSKQDGGADMRLKENQEGEPYQKEAGRKGGQSQGGQGHSDNYSGSNNNESTGNNQGQSNLGGEHLTKSGEPDMRFKENQEGEPYQKEAGHKGGSVHQGEGDSGNYDDSGSRNRGNEGQTEHLTQSGEPDMRFKENKEAYGQS